jgi:hypothetical protein
MKLCRLSLTAGFFVGMASISLLNGAPLPPAALTEVKIAPFAPPPAPIAPPAIAGPMESAAPTLEAAKNAKAVLENAGIVLTAGQRAFLNEHRFLLVPITSTSLASEFPEDGDWSPPDEMLAAFDDFAGDTSSPHGRTPGAAKLITPDIVLHAWHRYFSHLLEYVEGVQLRPKLEKMLTACMANATLLANGQSPEVQARLDWVNAQYSAAWVLLGSDEEKKLEPVLTEEEKQQAEWEKEVNAEMEAARPSSDPRPWQARLAFAKARLSAAAGAAVEKEVKFVMAMEGLETSPLYGLYDPRKPADYTQFRPRSHYTKSPELRSWFRSMMFLGRNGVNLTRTEAGLTDALLSIAVLCEPGLTGVPPAQAWREIMEVSAFFAGQSDDITFPEFRDWIVKSSAVNALSPAQSTDAKLLAALRGKLNGLRRPSINSAPHIPVRPEPDAAIEFRLFGQRFGWDAWVMDNLLDRDASGKLPTIVSGTTVMAAFGDDTAADAAREFLKETFGAGAGPFIADFDGKLPALRKKLAAVPDADWFTSMASKQLHTIGRLAAPREDWLPHYMRSPMFGRRQLGSMMGSWTELKHDTVLYAKQNYAELGEGGETDKPPPPPPRGFVQPDLSFWAEMSRLSSFAAEGLSRHRLLQDANEEFSTMRNSPGRFSSATTSP